MKKPVKPWGNNRLPFFNRIFKYQSNELVTKGYDFEKFIVSKFDTANYFTLLEWRGDKNFNGLYPLSSKYPDLEFNFRLEDQSFDFAVECKYRQKFTDDKVQWAKPHQLDNYRQFEKEKNIPVFVAIGIGGAPIYPNELYIIPLRNLNDIILKKSFLEEYRHVNRQQNFFLNCLEGTLK